MDRENLIAFEEEQITLSEEENITLVEVQIEQGNENVTETVHTVEVGMAENVVEIDSAFPPLGGSASMTDHGNLSGRYAPNQHPVDAITGLKDRLENLEALKQVRADKANIAQYYPWADGNPDVENRSGYFVAFTNHNCIKISQDNVIGIIVQNDKTGFVGNYIDDPSYGLVCVSGIVPVRALNSVKAGDKIIPGPKGYAQKSTNDYGYEVIDVYDELTEHYAIIALVPETVSFVDLKDDIVELDNKIDIVQSNTIVAINAANEALKSQSAQIDKIGEQANSAEQIANDANQTASSAQIIASNAGMAAEIAKEMADSAQTTVESIRIQVTKDISDATNNILELTKKVEPLTTWTNNGNTGAEYFIQHVENDLATNTSVSMVDSRVDNAFTAIQTNAKGLQTIALIERKYSAGVHSPSYGLSLSEAQETLKPGMIYVPTENVVEIAQGSNDPFNFYEGNSYEWNGNNWTETTDNVVLSDNYVKKQNNIKYWYVRANDVTNPDDNDIIYPANSLCEWIDNKWAVVASSKDVSASWVSSRIYQTASSLGAEIATANNNIISLSGRIDDAESSITAMAQNGDTIALIKSIANGKEVEIDNYAIYNGSSLIKLIDMNERPTGGEFYKTEPYWDSNNKYWVFSNTSLSTPISPCWAKFPGDNKKYYKYSIGTQNQWVMGIYEYANGFSGIKQQVNSNESRLNLVVSRVDGNDVVNAASIIAAVNASDSSIAITAGHIDLSGKVISLNAGGVTIDSNNFKVSAGGSITATAGTIGGWSIGENSLYTDNNTLYLGVLGISAQIDNETRNNIVFKAGSNFGVANDGTLYATNAHVSGTVTASDLKINGTSIVGGKFLSLNDEGNLKIGSMTIDGTTGSIAYDTPLVQTRYSTSQSSSIPDGWSDWNSSWNGQNIEVYAIYSYDGGVSWTDPMRVQGTNGSNGSDANVPSYVELKGINFTNITNSYIKSPKIYGGEFYGTEFNVISSKSDGAFNLYGNFNDQQYHFFSIYYSDGGVPYVNIESPDGAEILMNGKISLNSKTQYIQFVGNFNFEQASVTGLESTAVFG